jgi:hypothetical protein
MIDHGTELLTFGYRMAIELGVFFYEMEQDRDCCISDALGM